MYQIDFIERLHASKKKEKKNIFPGFENLKKKFEKKKLFDLFLVKVS
jgi:hypothetical protein